MPNTPDHKVAMFHLASRRVAEGKPSWAATIDLSDIFHDEEKTLQEKAKIISARFRVCSLALRDEEFLLLLDELEEQETADDFDAVWDEIYDWADYNRVWITL